MRSFVSLAILLCACPSLAAAQFSFVEGLFKNVTDVSMYGSFARFADRPPELAGGFNDGEARAGGLGGLGFEVLFAVGEFSARRPDSVTAVARDSADKDYRWSAEVGFGYSELRGFESAMPDTDVRGVVRELPAVSLYITWQPAEDRAAARRSIRPGWYWGVRTGLAELHGLRGYTGNPDDGPPDEIFVGGGSTFQLGLMAGGFVEIGSLALFLEPAYTHRQISGVEWTADTGVLADGLPRSLDMSTWSLAFGGQLGVGLAAGK